MIEYLPMDDMRHYISKLIATVFFVGLIPFAPGTFGTLAGMIFIWAAKPSFTWQLIILIMTLLMGLGVSGMAEKAFGQKDCGHIVIDEVVGYLCSIIFLPLTPAFMIAAFFCSGF